MAKLIIIDGNSLLFRAYYATYNPDATKLMHNRYGVPTNAIFAFSNMIVSLINDLNKDDGIFVAFDKGAHTFRHKQYEEYKANRTPCPTDLLQQMPLARKLLDALNILYYEDDNLEADDIAAIMAKNGEKEGFSVLLYTSDKDYLQLINKNITVKLIKRGLKDIRDMTPDSFKEEWGFDPIQIIDYKGLMGDPSDNLKGIPKVGDKTAKSLIIKYGTFDNIIAHASEQTPTLANNLVEFKEQGLMCKELATMETNYEIPFTPKSTIYKGYKLKEVDEFANLYDLRTLSSKLPAKQRIEDETAIKVTYEEYKKIDLKDVKDIGISIDISNDNYHDATLYGIGLTIENSNYYIDFDDLKKDEDLLNLIKDNNIKKYCFDYKTIKCVLAKNNIEINGLYFDILLGTYLIDAAISPNLNGVLSYYSIDINYAEKNDTLFSENNPLLSAVSSYYSIKLYNKIIAKLMEVNQFSLLNEIELPLANILADIEIEGFPVDKKTLLNFGNEYENIIKEKTKNIFKLVGHEFNINSTKELANILYNELNLKDNKKHSTSVEYLKELKYEHPIINEILEYRKYNKLLSTYVNGILPFIHEDNKVHATFNQATTQTGRLSSSEPNLQNISIRDEDGKQIRKAFFYQEDNLNILSLDYSQIELRILASLSNSKTLIEAFNNGGDIHTETAKIIFHSNKEPDSLQRRKAKAVNFGIIYGISDWGLAEQLNISIAEAKEIISNFNDAFPEIKDYLNGLSEKATTLGYATTLFNRRRYLPELKSPNYAIRQFGKRAAMNAPIQGSAADLIKIAMIKVDKALKENKYKARIVSQIHDELIIKVDDKEKDEVFKLCKEVMENCVQLNVKLKADGGYAKTWFDAK